MSSTALVLEEFYPVKEDDLQKKEAEAEERALPHSLKLRCADRECQHQTLYSAMFTEPVDVIMAKKFPPLMSHWLEGEAFCFRHKRPGMRSWKREFSRYEDFLKSRDGSK
ncbi:MAG: hypothetical protein ABIH21_02440 [Patescibacteria group bacterium]